MTTQIMLDHRKQSIFLFMGMSGSVNDVKGSKHDWGTYGLTPRTPKFIFNLTFPMTCLTFHPFFSFQMKLFCSKFYAGLSNIYYFQL
jgi:hypothetical protein